MPTETIDIAYVNQPGPGKKLGSLKDTKGEIWGIPPALLGLVSPGSTYEIFYEDREWQGRTYHTVKNIKPVNKLASVANTVVEKAGAAAGGKDPFEKRPTHPVDARRMFICGAFNAHLNNSNITSEEREMTALGEFLDKLDLLWRSKAYLGREKTQLADEMDDDIPY